MRSLCTGVSQFHATGSVEPKGPSGDHSKGLTEFESFTVLQSILHKPTAYLDEELFEITGTWVHLSTICRTINMDEITITDLAEYLSSFIYEVRKQDGSEFPPESLHHIVSGLQRFLRWNGKLGIDSNRRRPTVDKGPPWKWKSTSIG